MENTNKRKAKAVAIAAAAVLALAGTIAYLADASGIIRNQWDPNHVEVDIAETDVAKDDGTKDYSITPGATDPKDPKITVDTDTDAYVFAAVKDNINNAVENTTYVEYEIADGWIELTPEGDPSDMISQNITKYLNTFEDHKVAGNVTIDPNDANTKIYYRVVHGTNDSQIHGPFSVLKNDQVHYPSTLTNVDLDKLTTLTEEQKQLTFATYAIQMEPFCDPAETDAAKITVGAKDAWNQQVRVTGISLNKDTLTLNVEEEETLIATITPDSATNKDVTWTSSNPDVATVDENGKVTAVAPGTATITATSAADNTKTATCEVTVSNAASVKYAVQIYNTFDSDNDGTIDTLDFGPAIGVNVTQSYVSACNSEHCIHNDSWTRIKEHPEDYAGCKAAGCTKAVVLSIPSDTTGTIWASDAAEKTTTGDGVGVLIDELTTQARVWHASENIKIDDFSGKYEEATICSTLNELYNALPNDLKNAITEKTVSYKVWNDESETYSLRYSGSVTQKLWLQNEEDVVSSGKANYSVGSPFDLAKSDGLKSYNINGKVGNRWTSTSKISTNPRPDEDDNWCAATIDDNTYNEHINGTDTKVKAGIAPGFRISTSD